MVVDVLILGNTLIALKSFLPVMLIERRNGPHNRIPFRHGQAGIRQADDAAQNNLNHNHKNAEEQPAGNDFLFAGNFCSGHFDKDFRLQR